VWLFPIVRCAVFLPPLPRMTSASKRRRARNIEYWRLVAQQQLLTATAMVQVVEEEEEQRPRRGSVVGRETVKRDKYAGYHRLMADYFLNPPIFGENFFRRR
jgi:hypothetical protein